MPCELFHSCSKREIDSCLINNYNCLKHKEKYKKITCSEKGKKYELNNVKKGKKYIIARYHVDGGIIKNDSPKCDYLFLCHGDNHKVIFVELKGKNVNHACDQLYESIDTLNKLLPQLSDLKLYARIINSKTPPRDVANAHYKRLVELLQTLNDDKEIRIKIKERFLSETIDSLK